MRRAFSDAEREYYENNGKKSQTLAGMFAAKEALIKAAGLKITQIKLHQIQILHHENGAPYASFLDSANQLFAPYCSSISISHDGDYAVAVAFLQPKQ